MKGAGESVAVCGGCKVEVVARGVASTLCDDGGLDFGGGGDGGGDFGCGVNGLGGDGGELRLEEGLFCG